MSSEAGGQSPALASTLEFNHDDPMLPGTSEDQEEDLLSPSAAFPDDLYGLLLNDDALRDWTNLGLNGSAVDIISGAAEASGLEAPVMTFPQRSF